MYMFSRQGRIIGGTVREAMAWATGLTERVNQIVDTPVTLFAQTFSPAVGTLAWTTFVPDLQALETLSDKLLADEGYLAEVDRASQFIPGGVDDTLAQIVHGAPDPARVVTYASVVSTVVAPGALARGLEVAIELATKSEAITGNPGLVLTSATGPFGGVAWVNGFVDVAEMEAGNAALAADPDWVKLIDKKAPGVYTADPLATSQLIYRKIM
jgi:hypothetical protein